LGQAALRNGGRPAGSRGGGRQMPHCFGKNDECSFLPKAATPRLEMKNGHELPTGLGNLGGRKPRLKPGTFSGVATKESLLDKKYRPNSFAA